jgi:hypothetical protein
MRLLLIAILTFIFIGCANDSDPAADKANFTRIYDNNKYNASYYPIDIKQTPDGGYLILGGLKVDSLDYNIYLMKVDEFGGFISEQEVDENYLNPIGPILESGGNYYFFCMSSVGLQTQLFQMDADATLSSPISVGSSYPAAAALDGNNFLLLNYDNFNRNSVISTITPAGSITQSKSFSIGAGNNDAVDDVISSHFMRTGKQIPFLVGKAGSQYYFNGFYNYSLSLCFTNLVADDPQGIIQGQQDDGGLSQVMPLDGGKFALARFNFGDNYILPNTTLNTSGITSSFKLNGNPFPELVANAPVKILRTTIGTKKVALYASDTRSKQIALFGYDESTGEFIGSRYLGFSNPFEIASLTPTADGGLAICGTTYVAGRFPRICLFKLSKDEITESFQ